MNLLASQYSEFDGGECVVLELDCVEHCPPGAAYGSMDMRNRGLELAYEVTCWPKQKHGRFTTGESQPYTFLPDPVILNDSEKRMCQILGLDELELGTFLKSWQPAVRPKTVMGMQALLKYGDETKEWECKDCGHFWLARARIARCPHCNSAWWWLKSNLDGLSEAEKMTISLMYGEDKNADTHA